MTIFVLRILLIDEVVDSVDNEVESLLARTTLVLTTQCTYNNGSGYGMTISMRIDT